MTMIINDDRVCYKCGAYENSNGYCSNGHLFENPITKDEFENHTCKHGNRIDSNCSDCMETELSYCDIERGINHLIKDRMLTTGKAMEIFKELGYDKDHIKAVVKPPQISIEDKLKEAKAEGLPIINCKKCKKKTYIAESEGVGLGHPEKHYAIGKCVNCGSDEPQE